MTPREFLLMMDAHQEKLYDTLELLSMHAVMMRTAYHSQKKRMKPNDIFRRPVDKETEAKNIEEMKRKMKAQQEWLNQLNFGKG